MSFINQVKANIEKLPPWVGNAVSRLPYSVRPLVGKNYRKCRGNMAIYMDAPVEKKRQWVLENIRSMVGYAIKNVPFYRTLYGDHKITSASIETFEDIKKIPIIDKKMLQEVDIEQRSAKWPKRYKANTGGSSGVPLGFYICPEQMGVEWAHMHRIWQRLDFKPHYLKLTIAGRNIKDSSLEYDALRHHYAVNVCASWDDVAADIDKVLKKSKIRYLHGYPSAVYDFACYCESSNPQLAEKLKGQLKGAMLGSEYPNPVFRNKIESVFDISTVSWYGHTERCILAGELHESFTYEPFITYGFAEGIPSPDKDATMLVGTSFYNFASPFIRYNTEDEIRVTACSQGIMEKFEIAAGRNGDYIQDRNGKNIPLTALIFGRHHKIFDHCTHVQIYQESPGHAIIYATTEKDLTSDQLAGMFDSTHVEIDFEFKKITSPILTAAGKMNLKIKSDSIPS